MTVNYGGKQQIWWIRTQKPIPDYLRGVHSINKHRWKSYGSVRYVTLWHNAILRYVVITSTTNATTMKCPILLFDFVFNQHTSVNIYYFLSRFTFSTHVWYVGNVCNMSSTHLQGRPAVQSQHKECQLLEDIYTKIAGNMVGMAISILGQIWSGWSTNHTIQSNCLHASIILETAAPKISESHSHQPHAFHPHIIHIHTNHEMTMRPI